MDDLEKKIQDLAKLIVESSNVVALTGAGMSTESGIPDFRSPGTGLWEQVDPYEFASIDSFVAKGDQMFGNMLEIGMTIFRAKANKGHKALTKLQKLGRLRGVLTQNIDRLHQKARTKNIVELAVNHPRKLDGGIFEKDLAKVEEQLVEMFGQLMTALEESDNELGRTIMNDASIITRKTDNWVFMMSKGQGTPENSVDAICLALYIRYLKRICAHLRNIATSIVNPFHRIGFREKNQENKK